MNLAFLVDDDPIFQLLGKKLLLKVGLCQSTEVFPDGRAALNELKDRATRRLSPPDVILLDIRMPVLDGLGFLDGLVELPEGFRSRLRVIMVTSSLDPRERERALASPQVVAFLDKPMDLDKLVPALASCTRP